MHTERTTTMQTTTMRAIVQDSYGEAGDVLRLDRVDRPVIAEDEVLLRVHAAGVDRGVWHLMAGLPYPIRAAGFGLRAPKTKIRGMAVAGTVESVGAAVDDLRPGDEVYGVAAGSFAQFAAARADGLAPKPSNLTFEQAAAVPVSAMTALQAVRDHGRVTDGQHVLIIGASGGVGSYAVQIAVALGARVTGVSSTAKADLVRSLGAEHVIEYTAGEITDGDERYDVIVDIGGNRPLKLLRRALAPNGTLVITGGETGGRLLGGTDRQLRALVLSRFVQQDLRTFVASDNAADLRVLTGMIESGAVTPTVERTYPLEQTADAIQHLVDGAVRGKVVITV